MAGRAALAARPRHGSGSSRDSRRRACRPRGCWPRRSRSPSSRSRLGRAAQAARHRGREARPSRPGTSPRRPRGCPHTACLGQYRPATRRTSNRSAVAPGRAEAYRAATRGHRTPRTSAPSCPNQQPCTTLPPVSHCRHPEPGWRCRRHTSRRAAAAAGRCPRAESPCCSPRGRSSPPPQCPPRSRHDLPPTAQRGRVDGRSQCTQRSVTVRSALP